jgi:hypothetical protein
MTAIPGILPGSVPWQLTAAARTADAPGGLVCGDQLLITSF